MQLTSVEISKPADSNVIVGQTPGHKSWDKAVKDGWVPGKTLFPLEEAAKRGTIIQYLVSDAGQKMTWPRRAPSSWAL